MDQLIVDTAFQLETEIKQLRYRTNSSFWQMIDRLAKAKEIKIWEKLGHESWASWLAQDGIDFNVGSVDRYLRGYKAIRSRLTEAEALPLFSISRSKVLMVANRLTPENSLELIEKARVLSYSDLVLTVKELDNPSKDSRPPKPIFRWCKTHEKWCLVRGDISDICCHD